MFNTIREKKKDWFHFYHSVVILFGDKMTIFLAYYLLSILYPNDKWITFHSFLLYSLFFCLRSLINHWRYKLCGWIFIYLSLFLLSCLFFIYFNYSNLFTTLQRYKYPIKKRKPYLFFFAFRDINGVWFACLFWAMLGKLTWCMSVET
jgi:hypothetical protein